VIDTSVMVAGLVRNHELHAVARPHVVESARGQGPGIVVAKTWAALRRAPWNFHAATVAQTLGPWSSERRVAATAASAYAEALRAGRGLNLGGNVHAFLIAMTCRGHGLPLATLDRRQASLASGLTDLETILLLAEG